MIGSLLSGIVVSTVLVFYLLDRKHYSRLDSVAATRDNGLMASEILARELRNARNLHLNTNPHKLRTDPRLSSHSCLMDGWLANNDPNNSRQSESDPAGRDDE